ncbi:MAG: chromosome segregation protein SMC [Candidatus Sericytochromatia bacterium]|nr:chromosome segregation protein SMC [Candidatus Sericytochromatia bacterium]
MGGLRIVELEIDNFKTFRQERIRLLPGFTAITGPNGSGKSNILDALMFCLGLGNARTLRAANSTGFINGASSRREARVTVRFGHEDGSPAFEVARRVRERKSPDGGEPTADNTYYLDGKASTLTEIHELLGRHHISPQGFNVVMQMDVMGIIKMTPHERRRIIDDLAGVADFDSRIDLAAKELQTVAEQEDRTVFLLSELQARLASLRSQRDKAVEFLDLQERLRQLDRDIKAGRWWELQHQVTLQDGTVQQGRMRRGEAGEALRAAVTALDAAREEEQRLAERLHREGGARFQELEDQLLTTSGDRERVRLEGREAHRRSEEQDHLAVRADDRRRDLEAEGTGLDREISEVRERIREASDRVETHRKRREALQAELDQLMTGRQDLMAERQALVTRKEATEKQMNELQVAQMRVQFEQQQVEDRVEDARGRRKELAEQVRELGKDVDGLATQAAEAAKQAEVARADEQRAQQNVSSLKQTLETAEEALRATQKEAARVTGLLQAQEASLGAAVEFVLGQNVPGVLGTLSMLGEADPAFARALQEAAGGRMRNIVVTDDGVAAQIGRLLHQREIGRATCLPLNKLPSPRPLPRVNLDGCLGYAIDKVTFAPEHHPAFALALGETLIFETMTAARPHIGKYRMVTLDGDVLERTGAMTVGRSKQAPAMFLANLRQEGERLQTAVRNASQRVQNTQGALQAMLTGQGRAEARRREAEDTAAQADRERTARNDELQRRAEELQRLDQELKADQKRLTDLTREAEGLIESGLPLEQAYNDLELALSDLDDSLGDGRAEELRHQASEAQWAQQDAETVLQKERLTLESREGAREANRQAIAEQVELAGRNREEAKASREASAAADRQVAELAERIEGLTRAREEARKGLEALVEARNAATETRVQAESAVSIRERDIGLLDDAVKQGEIRLADLRAQWQGLENELWEEDIPMPTEAPLLSVHDLDVSRKKVEHRLAALGPVNQLAVEQYAREEEEARSLDGRLASLRTERQGIEDRIAEISVQKRAVFMTAFDQIRGFFAEIFGELAGGYGELSLERPEDPFAGGLIITAQPPGSAIARLDAMSGGQKSLTALAFLFSVQRTQPAPFYALDEVDQALDGVNVDRLGQMMRRQSELAQMVVISHRKPMIGHSDQGVGVYLGNDKTTRVRSIIWDNTRAAGA